ncbi:MAG: DUF362 domain-containing protein [Desulfarculus sp.]|nr:DUF362 domain-containing protein [Desulfarculus sp.]
MDRRDFLRRALGAGLTVAAAGALGLTLYDPKGPSAAGPALPPVKLPDFSLKAQAGRMAVVRGHERVAALQAGFKALGGLETFIHKGDQVLIKVNAGFATPPSLGATTNPELLHELIRQCLAVGAQRIVVTDNPINDPQSCFSLSGIGQAVQSAGGALALPLERYFRPTTVEGARLIRDWPVLHGPFEGVTKVIGLCPVKDHHRSGASMAMKNWYGLLGGRRNIFHQDIHTIIAELAMLMRPTLVILDGVVSMISNGPTGGSPDDLKATGTLIISTDQVAADALGATLLDKTPADLPFIGQAAALGLGRADWRSLKAAEVSL